MAAKTENQENQENQVVSFKLKEEEFGIDIMQVQEIIKIPEITRVPKAPEFVEGVIDLRGGVLPVIDCRRRFELELEEWTDSNRILVVNIKGKMTGIIVDSVSEVLRLSEDAIESAPSLMGVGAEYLQGIGKLEEQGRLINLVNLQRLLAIEGIDKVSEVSEVSENLKSITQEKEKAKESEMDKAASDETQVVSFRLGEEEYAVGISQVREIIRMPEVTKIPKAPSFVEGIINLRDMVLPIISLRKRFELEDIEKTDSLRIVVIEIGGISTGMIVDSVSEVLHLSKRAIEPPPPIIGLDTTHLQGIGKLEDGKRLLLLLDLSRLLSTSEKRKLSQLSRTGETDIDKDKKEGRIMTEDEEQLVSFKIENEEFGVNIEEVQEIIRLPEITRVPQAPFFVEGVINLRGNTLPVIDLRKRFDLEVAKKTNATRIMVANVEEKTTGIIVDSVSEVLRLSKEAIEPPPPIVAGIEAKYLRGMGKLNNGENGKKLLILLNLKEILTVRKEDKARREERKPLSSGRKERTKPEPVKLEKSEVKEEKKSESVKLEKAEVKEEKKTKIEGKKEEKEKKEKK